MKAKGLGMRTVQPQPAPPVPVLHWTPLAPGVVPNGAIIGPVTLLDWYPRWDRKTGRDMALVETDPVSFAPPWVSFTAELMVHVSER